jgi:putative transposase
VDPDGVERIVSRTTLDRWIRAYRCRGLQGLMPTPRSDTGALRRHPELFEEAAAMRREMPSRSAELIAEQLTARHGIAVSPRTIRSQLASRGLTWRALMAEPAVFGRYEAERVNQRWIGDYLIGPWVPHPKVTRSRRAKLVLFVDDKSRLLVHGVWGFAETTRFAQLAFKAAILRRGIPESLYLDRGAGLEDCRGVGVRRRACRSRQAGRAAEADPATRSPHAHSPWGRAAKRGELSTGQVRPGRREVLASPLASSS